MINRSVFFQDIRHTLFDGRLTQEQVTGISLILDYWERKHPVADIRFIAYSLATTYHETNKAMVPLEELGKGAGKSYGKLDPVTNQIYYGRGLVQLTWKYNYIKQGTKLGLNLVNFPDLALTSLVAVEILVEGMLAGDFTGIGLSHYFSTHVDDPTNARRIINGLDKASIIAYYHAHFLAALT